MSQEELEYYFNNPVKIEDSIKETCTNISLSAQSLIKKELTKEHLEILKNLSISYNRLSYTKMLTISIDNLDFFKKAELVEEIAGAALDDLSKYIYSKSNKSDTVAKYISYAIKDAFNLNEERMDKLFELVTVKFNGKKIDKRK